jgi:hypothetical protein
MGFKTVITYALELPMGPQGQEPSMQSLIMTFSQWFVQETVKINQAWVGKTIIVGSQ